MPGANSITLSAANIADTTSDIDFNIVDRQGDTTTFRHLGDGALNLAERLQVTVKQPKATSKYCRVLVSIAKPETITDSDTGVTSEYFTNRASVEFQMDKRSSAAQITAVVERFIETLKNADIKTAVTNVENFY